ncbi:MAG: trypsin-like serine protease [Planctomycetota bacterium]
MRTHTARICSPVSMLAVVGGVLPANAIVIRHDVADQAYLDFAASEFSSVGRMIFQDGDSQFWNGSGTLIDSRWVLTAAHVVDDAADTDWFFDTGAGTQRVQADAVFYHPEWFNDGPVNGDMALVRLSEPILNVEPTQLFDGATPFGSEVALAGYGGSGDGTTGWTGSYDLLRRAGTNVLETNDPFGFGDEYLMFDFDDPATGEATELEAMLMFGDSGGAIMADVDGSWQLIGVNTFIIPNADEPTDYGMYGDWMGSTSVEFHRDWIDSVIPAPGSAALIAAGLLGMTRRRRGC